MWFLAETNLFSVQINLGTQLEEILKNPKKNWTQLSPKSNSISNLGLAGQLILSEPYSKQTVF